LEYTEETALEDDFRSSEKFRDTINDFRYSSLHDRGGPFAKALFSLMKRTIGVFFTDIPDDVPRFHELPLPRDFTSSCSKLLAGSSVVTIGTDYMHCSALQEVPKLENSPRWPASWKPSAVFQLV
jgi:hypothetical protein